MPNDAAARQVQRLPGDWAQAEKRWAERDPMAGWGIAQRAAQRLRQARIDSGLSLSDVGSIAGIPGSTAGSYERNERWFGDPARLADLCALYGISVADLFREEP